MEFIVIYFLNVIALLASVFMIYSKSPVKSVLSLIFIFVLTTFTFINLSTNFATLVLLLVYLGAVIVMFLILVMFVNVKIYNYSPFIKSNLYWIFIMFFFIVLFFFVKIDSNIFFFLKWFSLYDYMPIVSVLSAHLWSLHGFELYLIAFILLIAMVSAMSIVFIEVQNIWKTPF